MSFMQKTIYESDYYSVETTTGTEFIPTDVCGNVQKLGDLADYLEGKVDEDCLDEEPEIKHGWVARMSAPGYLDCTAWSAYDSAEEASKSLDDMYGTDEFGD